MQPLCPLRLCGELTFRTLTTKAQRTQRGHREFQIRSPRGVIPAIPKPVVWSSGPPSLHPGTAPLHPWTSNFAPRNCSVPPPDLHRCTLELLRCTSRPPTLHLGTAPLHLRTSNFAPRNYSVPPQNCFVAPRNSPFAAFFRYAQTLRLLLVVLRQTKPVKA